MNKKLVTIRVEVLLYLVLVVAAAWLRMAELEWPPLNNEEAIQALAVLQETPSASSLWTETDSLHSVSPAYKVLTAVVFQLLGSSDAWARLVPALFGLALVFTPLLLREQLGSARTLATAYILGFSPTLIAASRTAGGIMLASVGIIAAFALMLYSESKARGIWVAIALGLALASGAEAITGLIGLGITIGIAWLQQPVPEEENGEEEAKNGVAKYLWLAPIVALVIASGLGIHLRGISDLFDSLANWIHGWTHPRGVHQLTLWAMLPFYEPLILVLGIGGAILAWRRQNRRGFALLSWALVSMVLASIYPARQPSYVVWAVIPLAFLAGDALAYLMEQWTETRLGTEIIGLVSMILVAFIFGYLNLTAYSSGSLLPVEDSGMLLLFAGAVVVLLVAGILLFGLGWSWELAWRGVSITVVIVCFAFSFSAGYQQSLGPNAGTGRELWRPQASTSGLPMLAGVLESLSVAQTGCRDCLEMEVSPDVTPGIAWALRDFSHARLANPLLVVQAPVVLMPEYGGLSGITDAYTGQVIGVSERWGWTGSMPRRLMTWLLDRDAPALQERWLLFAMSDIFNLAD
jgi:4-amino-4-deoxy-L-arabinose transferase-like glycosyltransferase